MDADKLRVSAAPETTVLVGWFDSDEENAWMLAQGSVVLRLGKRRGSLPLIKSLAAASHILLHGHDYATVPGLLRIAATAGEVLTRAELQARGFPADASGSPDHIYAVFSVTTDEAFQSFAWNGRKLDEAVVRFTNRQRPAYKTQLTAMGREGPKPQLVSLADLQLALAGPA